MDNNDKRTDKSLRFSLFEGIFASGMVGFTQEYFTPFLLLLGGSGRHVGMLNAFPNLFSSLLQYKTADIAERLKSRKMVMNIFVLLQSLMFLPMGIIALKHIRNPFVFIAFVVLFSGFGALAMPAWGSLLSDLVDKSRRGVYFGWRNRIMGFVTVTAAFLAGLILHVMKKVNVFYGFLIIFIFAFIFRIVSWFFLFRIHEPFLSYKKENRFGLVDFLSRMRESNFAKYCLFTAMMNFSVHMSAPFFSVFMLRDLHFSYLLYTLLGISHTLTAYLFISRWGRLGDAAGNLRIIKFVSVLIGIIPILWIFNRHPAYLFFAQLFSGFAWAGFNLCTVNFVFDAVTPEKRTRCISYFNIMNGLGLCLGSLTGGFLLSRLPHLFGYRILTLFLISSGLRIIVSIFMPLKLKEVRAVRHCRNDELLLGVLWTKKI